MGNAVFYTPAIRAAGSPLTSRAYSPLCYAHSYQAHEPSGCDVDVSICAVCLASTTLVPQHVFPRTWAPMGKIYFKIHSIPSLASILAVRAPVMYLAQIVSTPAPLKPLAHRSVLGRFATLGPRSYLIHRVPLSRRGFQNNFIPLRKRTPSVCLGLGVSPFLPCTRPYHVTCTLHTF